MFESDDYDQVLSQFEFPEESKPESSTTNSQKIQSFEIPKPIIQDQVGENLKINTPLSSIHMKRKIINSHFDHKTKRKFPGPAGLLTGNIEETKDNKDCHIELLSQDIDHAQCHLQKHLFESPLWVRLLDDLKGWKFQDVNTIKSIKQLALDGNLRKMKAPTVAAFVVMVDRSAIDPLVTLRDGSGTIKCTLHRDAWSIFSQYIIAEFCAIVLWKPTVLTTGSTYKKHYLNITLSNILALYSSTMFPDNEDTKVPDSYVRIQGEPYTIFKRNPPYGLDTKIVNNHSVSNFEVIDDLDNLFSDDLF